MKAALESLFRTAFAAAVLAAPALAAAAGEIVYIPLGSAGKVVIVDTERDAVVDEIDGLPAVHHVAVSPDGRFAVVTHPNEGGISAIDLASYAVAPRVATGPFPNYAVFSPDGGQVFVSDTLIRVG
jgi:DNA-binding beta-propeller fold protein YncE